MINILMQNAQALTNESNGNYTTKENIMAQPGQLNLFFYCVSIIMTTIRSNVCVCKQIKCETVGILYSVRQHRDDVILISAYNHAGDSSFEDKLENDLDFRMRVRVANLSFYEFYMETYDFWNLNFAKILHLLGLCM